MIDRGKTSENGRQKRMSDLLAIYLDSSNARVRSVPQQPPACFLQPCSPSRPPLLAVDDALLPASEAHIPPLDYQLPTPPIGEYGALVPGLGPLHHFASRVRSPFIALSSPGSTRAHLALLRTRSSMDFPTSPGRAYAEHINRPWSPQGRPTVTTSGLQLPSSSAASVESSPHLSSVPHSAHASPWVQHISLNAAGQPTVPSMLQHSVHPLPHAGDLSAQHGSVSNMPNQEWGNMFSSPLDPSTFHALAASGVLPPPNAGLPSSLPARSMRSPNEFSANVRITPLNTKDIGRPGAGQGLPPAHWSNAPSPYSGTPSTSQRASPLHFRPGSGSQPYGKRRSPVNGLPQYGPINMPSTGSSMAANGLPYDNHRLPDGRDGGPHSRRSSLSHHLNSAGLPSSGGQFDVPLGPLSEGNIESFSAPFPPHPSSLDFGGVHHHHSERSNASLPPSLWMSPASVHSSAVNVHGPSYPSLTQITVPRHGSLTDSLGGSTQSPTNLSFFGDSAKSSAPTSASSPKAKILSDLFADDLFPHASPLETARPHQSFSSPRLSGSPDLKAAELAAGETDPEKLQREDPLATQVWKMYARQKATLPHAQRMENITWRMMALALKKKKEDEERIARGEPPLNDGQEPDCSNVDASKVKEEVEERGRPIDKGKARVQVVGFDGANQDGIDDNEYVNCVIFIARACFKRAFAAMLCLWTGER